MEYRLVAFTQEHAKEVISWVPTAEDVLLFAGSAYQFPLTEDQLIASANDENQRVFSFVNKENEVLVHCQLFLLADAIKIGRVIIPQKYRGRSLGKGMMLSLMDYIQIHFPNKFITLNVFTFNTKAIQLYEKLGFVRQETGMKTVEINGQTWTSVLMDYRAH